MIFALSALPVIGAIGVAVDFSKANDVKSQMQNALDAAVLAGVTQASANQVSTAGTLFDLNVNGKYAYAARALVRTECRRFAERHRKHQRRNVIPVGAPGAAACLDGELDGSSRQAAGELRSASCWSIN